MLTAWLGDNNSTDWPMGLCFVQFQKNSNYHSGINQSPYNALFGTEVTVGLCSSTLPTEILERIVFEDDPIAAYATRPESETSTAAENPAEVETATHQKTRRQQTQKMFPMHR